MEKGSTKISGSPQEFVVSSFEFEDDTLAIITLCDLESTNTFERGIIVGGEKQDIIAAGGSGVWKVPL